VAASQGGTALGRFGRGRHPPSKGRADAPETLIWRANAPLQPTPAGLLGYPANSDENHQRWFSGSLTPYSRNPYGWSVGVRSMLAPAALLRA
jgi:hypothetical protein